MHPKYKASVEKVAGAGLRLSPGTVVSTAGGTEEPVAVDPDTLLNDDEVWQIVKTKELINLIEYGTRISGTNITSLSDLFDRRVVGTQLRWEGVP